MHDHPDFPSVIGGGCIHFTEQTLVYPDLALFLSRNVFSRDLCLHDIFFSISHAFFSSLNVRTFFPSEVVCMICFGTSMLAGYLFLKITNSPLKVKWSAPQQVTLLIWLPGPGGPYRTHYLHSRFGIGHKHRRAVKSKNEMLRMFYNRYLSCLPFFLR